MTRPDGIKARRRARSRRAPARWLAAALALLVLGGVAIAVWPRGPERRAVIVDQLSLTAPNPEFAEDAGAILEAAGHTVDYVAGEDVTVDFYRKLPARGYDLVVLRVHSARRMEDGEKLDDVALFTSEIIDPARYKLSGLPVAAATAASEAKQRARNRPGHAPAAAPLSSDDLSRLIPVYYNVESTELPFFGLRPEFVRENAEGRFERGTTVVMMGCDGLRSDALASAFVHRGVETFVSWDEPVTAPHTDRATLGLLERLLLERQAVEDAIRGTMEAYGPDPENDARLIQYPPPPGGNPTRPVPTPIPSPTPFEGQILTGRVFQNHSQPLANMQVSLFSISSDAACADPGALAMTTRTDQTGHYQLAVADPGRYKIAAWNDARCPEPRWNAGYDQGTFDVCEAHILDITDTSSFANIAYDDPGCAGARSP